MTDPDAPDNSQDETDLNPPLGATGLPEAIARLREDRARRHEASRARWEPLIDAHIQAHRLALDFLAETHQWVADTFDFDVVGVSRPAAMWQMSGRCLGIARLILDALKLGYTAEVLHLARAVHEANGQLSAFHMPGEGALVRRWLDGGYISPVDARKAEERYDQRIREAMEASGGTWEPKTELRRDMFGHLSEAAHHRRRWTEDAVFADERAMIVGPTENWTRRAATTGTLVAVVEETVLTVGDSLSQFIPDRTWYSSHVQPFIDTFAALRATQPLV